MRLFALLSAAVATLLPAGAAADQSALRSQVRWRELTAIDSLITEGECDIAVAGARELARQVEARQGPRYVGLAEIHAAIGRALRRQSRFDDASVALGQALELWQHNLGEVSAPTLFTLRDLAAVHREAGRLDEARRLAERAKDLVERLPPHETLEAGILVELARVIIAQQKDADAEHLLVRALAIQDDFLGAAHADAVETARLLIDLHERRRQPDKAARLRGRLSAETSPDTAARCILVVTALRLVADIHRAGGDLRTPVELVRHGLAITEQEFGPDDPNTAVMRAVVADTEAVARGGTAAGPAAGPAKQGVEQ